MGSLGPMEIFLIFLVILLVFGAKRIPEIARGLGKGIREFKSATKDITDEFNIDDRERIDSPRRPASGTTQPRQTAYEPAEPRPAPPAPEEEKQASREGAGS